MCLWQKIWNYFSAALSHTKRLKKSSDYFKLIWLLESHQRSLTSSIILLRIGSRNWDWDAVHSLQSFGKFFIWFLEERLSETFSGIRTQNLQNPCNMFDHLRRHHCHPSRLKLSRGVKPSAATKMKMFSPTRPLCRPGILGHWRSRPRSSARPPRRRTAPGRCGNLQRQRSCQRSFQQQAKSNN